MLKIYRIEQPTPNTKIYILYMSWTQSADRNRDRTVSAFEGPSVQLRMLRLKLKKLQYTKPECVLHRCMYTGIIYIPVLKKLKK